MTKWNLWFTEKIICIRSKENRVALPINALTLDTSNVISSSKLKYHERLANKLNDSKKVPNIYMVILKTFVNGSKIPLIPPLLVDNKLVTDFLDKANLFNNFFAKQCTPISNDSTVPANMNFWTREILSSLEFCVDDIFKIIRSLDQNKTHAHDETSIRMKKLCASSISKPLHLIFRNCLETETFPNVWIKANIISVDRKGDKELVTDYQPVSLVPIYGKVFEKMIFNSFFVYLNNNNNNNNNNININSLLNSSDQSRYGPGDSCAHQLISIIYDIYKAFDANPSLGVRGVFLDLSKAFDKV